MINTKNHQSGYTLIELLLYITILGSLLAGISMYFVSSTSARVKSQTIAEVDRQGELAMETILQTIRGADSITSPTAGTTGSTLTLAVPSGLLSPTVFSHDGSGSGGGDAIMGLDQDGGTPGDADGNMISATKVVATASGTVSELHAFVGTAAPSGSNKAQMAIYSGASPTTLLANSTSKLISSLSWNTFTISPVSVTQGETYWIAYNAFYYSDFTNNVQLRSGSADQSRIMVQTYNSWPASWVGTSQSIELSVYATVVGGGSSGVMQIKEGLANNVPLTNSKVEISNLTFKNLTRSGTPGVVQVSFTIYRVNPNNRSEYDYQKTFTGTAALR